MDNTVGEKRVLHFGNLDDIIFCKKSGWQVLQNKINACYVLWAEYEYDDGWHGNASVEDPCIQELNAEIDLLEEEQKLILSDIKSLEQELALQKCRV